MKGINRDGVGYQAQKDEVCYNAVHTSKFSVQNHDCARYTEGEA